MCSKTIFRPENRAVRRLKDAVDEHRFAVEHIDVGVGHLAMDAQHHADPLHPLERRMDIADVGDAAALLVVAPAG